MKKITLEDIMESLNSDDMVTAQASLHEWFVAQSRQVHAKQTGQIVESEDDDDDDDDEVKDVNEATDTEDEDDALEEARVPADAAAEKNAADGSKEPGSVESEEIDESEEDLIAELAESFAGLETVSDKLQNQEGAQVGEQGKIPVNKKSTLPNNKADKRLAGEPVEIKSNGHTGHALEKAPKVAAAPVKHHVQNSKDDLKKVDTKGDKSAILNKKDGFGADTTPSPISGKGMKGLK